MKGIVDSANLEDFKYENCDFGKTNSHGSGYLFIGMFFDMLQKLGIITLQVKRRKILISKNIVSTATDASHASSI